MPCLQKELGVERNIRHRRVGITGTNYTPLDNEFQIREALEDTVQLINGKSNIFEKALLALVLLSYIRGIHRWQQAHSQNREQRYSHRKRFLPYFLPHGGFYRLQKAMLMFYEQNNIAAFKRIFIDQFLFAVKTYF